MNKIKPIQNKNLTVFSMDVTALYPSITAEMAIKAAKESIKTSRLKWRNIDVKYLGRYVSMCCEREVLEKDNLGEGVPAHRPRTTLNSVANPSKELRKWMVRTSSFSL